MLTKAKRANEFDFECPPKQAYAFGTNASFDFMKYVSISIGSGNTMVEFFSAEMVFSVWR